MATEVGSAFVSVMPSMKGFGSQLGKGVDGESSRAGKRGGRTFGTAFARTGVGPIKAGFGTIGKLGAGLFAGLAVGNVFKSFIADARESAKVGAITASVIKSTGGAANLTARQVGSLATAISNKTGIDDEQIQANENVLLTFTKVRNEVGKGNDVFTRATGLAQDMATVLGTDAAGASIQLGKALNDPIKGITALSRAGVSFTQQQKDQIKALVKNGDTLGAQKIILGEVAKEFGGAAAAASTPMDKLKVTLGNVGEQIGGTLIPWIDKGATAVTTRLIPAFSHIAGKVGDFAAPLVAKAKEVAPQIGAAITSGFATVKITMTPIIAQIATGAQAAAATVITGVKTGLDTGNWAPLGASIGRALITAIQGAGTALAAIGKVLGDMLAKVDWVGIGVKMGQQAPSLLIGLAVGLLNFDIVGLLRGLAAHWQLALFAVISIAFAPAKVIGKVAELLSHIPLVGRLLAWALEHFAGFSKGLVRMVGDAFGFVGRALLDGIRMVFPNAGRALESAALGLPLRINTAIVQLAVKGGQLVARFVGAIRARISEVGAQGALMANAVVRPFARAGTWLLSAGKAVIQGLINGIMSMIDAVGGAMAKVAGKLRGYVPFSPAKEGPLRVHPMDQAGINMMEQLAAGLRKGGKKAVDAMQEVLGKVSDKLSSLRDAAASVRSSVADSVKGIIDLSQIGTPIPTGAQDAEGADIMRTPSVSETFAGFAASAKAFAGALAEMARKKFAPAIIAAVAAAGPVQGLTAAQAFAAAPAAEVTAVNASMGEIQAAAKSAGTTVLNTTRIPADISREEAVLRELQEIRKQLGKDVEPEVHIKGDDLYIVFKRVEKKNKGR